MNGNNNKPAPLAYENTEFINSSEGRILRLMAEYVEPLSRFRREQIQDTVVFFGSARFHSRSDAQRDLHLIESGNGSVPGLDRPHALAAVDMARYYEDARRLAFLLTQWSTQIRSRRARFVVTT